MKIQDAAIEGQVSSATCGNTQGPEQKTPCTKRAALIRNKEEHGDDNNDDHNVKVNRTNININNNAAKEGLLLRLTERMTRKANVPRRLD